MLVYLKKQGNVDEKNNVACVFPFWYKGLLENYSKQYFNEDICSNYLSSLAGADLGNYKYLIIFNISDEHGVLKYRAIAADWTLKLESSNHIWQLCLKSSQVE